MSAAGGAERISAAFASSTNRAALMPYVMGGFPTLEESVRIGQACVAAGADVIVWVFDAAGTRARTWRGSALRDD